MAWTKKMDNLILQHFLHVVITFFYKVKHNAMGEWRYGSVFFTMALDEGMWSVVYPGYFTPGERTLNADRTAGWVGPRANVGLVPKRNPTLFWKLVTDHPAHSLLEIMGNKWGE